MTRPSASSTGESTCALRQVIAPRLSATRAGDLAGVQGRPARPAASSPLPAPRAPLPFMSGSVVYHAAIRQGAGSCCATTPDRARVTIMSADNRGSGWRTSLPSGLRVPMHIRRAPGPARAKWRHRSGVGRIRVVVIRPDETRPDHRHKQRRSNTMSALARLAGCSQSRRHPEYCCERPGHRQVAACERARSGGTASR